MPYEVARRGPPRRWARATRLSEKEPTQTRSQAPVRLISSSSGTSAGSAFTSTFQRASGKRSSSSSKRGTGSLPATLARATSLHGRSAMRPARSVTRSRVGSWKAASTPSAVRWTSVSRYR